MTSRAQLRAWLLENHNQTGAVWLVRWKKAAGGPDRYLSTQDVLDELTVWAKSYRDRAERLVAQC